MGNVIHIIDVTNRDGVQTSRLGLAKLEKTIINMLLNQMGIYQSEFGFPTTDHETNYLNANLELAAKGVLKPIRLSGWMRAIPADVTKAFHLAPDLKAINISASTSKQLIDHKYFGKRIKTDVTADMVAAVKLAQELGAASIGVNAEDASRTDLDYLIEFAAAAKAVGAERFRYCDTLGYDDPFTLYERIRKIAEAVKIDIELHCHNDLGMVTACSVAGAKAAIDGGVDAYINTTVNGMGERAGNSDLVATILAILKSSGFAGKYQLDPRIDLSKSWQIAKYVSYAFGVQIPINQVGVGNNAFAHESGIHADGALKDRKNYELFDYEELGRGEPEIIETGRMITTGEYGGIKGFRNVYEKMEIEFKDDVEAKKILDLVRYANVHTQKPLTALELRFVAKYPEIARKIMTVTP
jgi:homocitrate synthase NifV